MICAKSSEETEVWDIQALYAKANWAENTLLTSSVLGKGAEDAFNKN